MIKQKYPIGIQSFPKIKFKYNKSIKEAREQIHDRDYAGRYAPDHRTVYLIGANFNENKERRELNYEIEMMMRQPNSGHIGAKQ